MAKKTELKYGPRSAKTLGIKVKTQKEFTTPDGKVFDHYSKALKHTRQITTKDRLVKFLHSVDRCEGEDAFDFIIGNMEELREILK